MSLDDVVFDIPEFSTAERLDMAYRAWKDTGNTLSLRAIASKFQVSRTTLQGRAKGAIPKRESNAAKRRLCVGEEEALKDWCIQLAKWGWPPRVCQLRTMATELLRAKSDRNELGVHWQEQFLSRFPELKSKYINGLDKNRFSAQDPVIFTPDSTSIPTTPANIKEVESLFHRIFQGN
jgi:Tc5 transposase DNA-binding domain